MVILLTGKQADQFTGRAFGVGKHDINRRISQGSAGFLEIILPQGTGSDISERIMPGNVPGQFQQVGTAQICVSQGCAGGDGKRRGVYEQAA
jgi:hypothetical protein